MFRKTVTIGKEYTAD